METLKYKVITGKKQYKEYCNILERLVFSRAKDKNIRDEIALLTILVEKWDVERLSSTELNPIQLLHSFIKDHDLKAKDLVEILGISKGYVSDILNYKKGLSKGVIRKLANHFKVSQEAFNRPYKLAVSENARLQNENTHSQNTSARNTKKKREVNAHPTF